MAKKKEFKADKPYSGVLSHLYITGIQRRKLLLWGLYGAVLVLLSVVQDVLLCRVRVLGATTDLVPCAIILISILEGPERGSVFSLVASALYLFSGMAPGVYAMVIITVLSVFGGIIRQGYLQKRFFSVALCVAAATLIYEMGIFLLGLFFGLTTPARVIGFLITAGSSVVVTLALYPLFAGIAGLGGEVWKEKHA